MKKRQIKKKKIIRGGDYQIIQQYLDKKCENRGNNNDCLKTLYNSLAVNPKGIEFMKINMNKWENLRVWNYLCSNDSEEVVDFLETELDKWGNFPLNWDMLSGNPTEKAVQFLRKHKERWENNIECWINLCNNGYAIPFLKEHDNRWNYRKQCWKNLCSNPNVMEWFGFSRGNEFDELSENDIDIELNEPSEEYINSRNELFKNKFLDWEALSGNPNAVPILEQNWNRIDWKALSGNPNGIPLLEQLFDEYLNRKKKMFNFSRKKYSFKGADLKQNFSEIDWEALSGNINAIPLLEQHLNKVDWKALSGNINAIPLLEKHFVKVDWEALSGNTNAMHILEAKHLDKVNWGALSGNTNADTLLRGELQRTDLDWRKLSAHPNILYILGDEWEQFIPRLVPEIFLTNPYIFTDNTDNK